MHSGNEREREREGRERGERERERGRARERERRGKRRGRGVISEVINILRTANDAQPRSRGSRSCRGCRPGARRGCGSHAELSPEKKGQQKGARGYKHKSANFISNTDTHAQAHRVDG